MGIRRQKPLARKLGDRHQPLAAVQRRALDPRQRLPGFDAVEDRQQRSAARREGERRRREVQVIRDHRQSGITGGGEAYGRRHEARRSPAGAPHLHAFEDGLVRRLVQREDGGVFAGARQQPRDGGNAVGSGQVGRQDDDRHVR